MNYASLLLVSALASVLVSGCRSSPDTSPVNDVPLAGSFGGQDFHAQAASLKSDPFDGSLYIVAFDVQPASPCQWPDDATGYHDVQVHFPASDWQSSRVLTIDSSGSVLGSLDTTTSAGSQSVSSTGVLFIDQATAPGDPKGMVRMRLDAETGGGAVEGAAAVVDCR